jgi:hypothetical protein
MFRKNRYFPIAMIIYLISSVVLQGIDTYFAFKIYSSLPIFEESLSEIYQMLIQDMLRIVVSSTIWIPYFLVSKRVKATFHRIKNLNEEAVVIENPMIKKGTLKEQ